jgi:hypothetical protein
VLSSAALQATATDMERVRAAGKQDGTLFREYGSDKVYVVVKGTRFLISGREELQALGYDADKVTDVPAGALSALQDRPPDGTLLRERGKAHVWVYQGGRKRWVTSPTIFEKSGFDWNNVKTVPNGSLGEYTDGSPMQ